MIEKPECRLCSKVEQPVEKIAEELLYSLFNPYHRDEGQFDVTELIRRHLSEKLVKDFELYTSTLKEFTSYYWMDRIPEIKDAKRKAWEELKEMLSSESILPDQLSMSQVVDNFFDEVIEELQNLGYIESIETRFHRKIINYTPKAEKVLGEKVLSLSLQNLEKKDFGEHETEKVGVSAFSGEILTEYDPYLHVFDNIDLVESMIKSAVRGKIEFEESEMLARQPKHMEKCVYVMLIDVSDSMRGRKIVGAI